MNWLSSLKWSPFAVVIIIVIVVVSFIAIWDTIHSIDIPAYIVAILSIIAGGTGATVAVSHGVSLTSNGKEKTL